MQFKSSFYLCFAGLVVVAGNLLAQQPVQEKAPIVASDTARTRPLSDYVLGPNDEFTIMAIDWEEVAGKSIRIGTGGDINLPMAGRIQVAGMTAKELEAELIRTHEKIHQESGHLRDRHPAQKPTRHCHRRCW